MATIFTQYEKKPFRSQFGSHWHACATNLEFHYARNGFLHQFSLRFFASYCKHSLSVHSLPEVFEFLEVDHSTLFLDVFCRMYRLGWLRLVAIKVKCPIQILLQCRIVYFWNQLWQMFTYSLPFSAEYNVCYIVFALPCLLDVSVCYKCGGLKTTYLYLSQGFQTL